MCQQLTALSPACAGLRCTEGWRLAGPAPGGAPVEMILALPQIGADWLDETFEAVSNPDSPRYGANIHSAATRVALRVLRECHAFPTHIST